MQAQVLAQKQTGALGWFFPADQHHLDGFFSEVGRCIPARGRALDVGCGDNTILDRFRSDEREIWGTDFQQHPELSHLDHFKLMQSDGRLPFEDGTFDVVVCVSVMEHVENPHEFLGEIMRVLKPGGRFVGHTISGAHYVTWIRRAFGMAPHAATQKVVKLLYGRDEVDTFPTRYRLNRARTIEQAAARVGLTRERIKRYADPGYFSFARPLIPVAVATDWALSKVSPELGRLYFTATLLKPATTAE
jgi:SAM-dependent methyltransferase